MLFAVLVIVGMIFVGRQLLLQRRITARQGIRRKVEETATATASAGAGSAETDHAAERELLRVRGEDA